MSLWKATTKYPKNTFSNNISKGMSVEISCITNPITQQNGQPIQDAFMRVYGVDLRKACMLVASYLEIVKK